MIYRVLSRLFAIIDTTLSVILLGLVVMWGFRFFLAIVLQSISPGSELIILGLICAILLICCSFFIIVSQRLIQATRKGIHPNSAIDLSKLWWISAWFLVVIVTLRFLSVTVKYYSDKNRYGDDGEFNWESFLEFTFLLIHGMGLFCVYQFRKEMAAAIPQVGPFIPLAPIMITNCDHQNQRIENNYYYDAGHIAANRNYQPPPPSYETTKSSESYYPPPPPYTTSFSYYDQVQL